MNFAFDDHFLKRKRYRDGNRKIEKARPRARNAATGLDKNGANQPQAQQRKPAVDRKIRRIAGEYYEISTNIELLHKILSMNIELLHKILST